MSSPRDDQLDAAARYLATGDRAELPDERLADELGLDRVRVLLGSGSTWAEPSPGLLGSIIQRIDAPPLHRRRSRPRWTTGLVVGGLAAAAIVVVALVVTDALGPSTEPGGTQVALAGTELAPNASAEATLRPTPSGVAITLHVEGLDPAPLGFYYQAWVKGPAGTVAIGTFHVRDGDDEPIELWSGVETDDYPEITVTLEPEDGDPASSGQKVLGGAVG